MAATVVTRGLGVAARGLLRGLGVLLLTVVSFLAFGNLVGFLLGKPLIVEGEVARTMAALALSGTVMGALLALPAVLFVGRRFAAVAVALAGVPTALLSFPPAPEAMAANGGVVAYVGAASCTLLAAVVTFAVVRMATVLNRP